MMMLYLLIATILFTLFATTDYCRHTKNEVMVDLRLELAKSAIFSLTYPISIPIMLLIGIIWCLGRFIKYVIGRDN